MRKVYHIRGHCAYCALSVGLRPPLYDSMTVMKYSNHRSIKIFIFSSGILFTLFLNLSWGLDESDLILGKWMLGKGDVCVEVNRVGSEYIGRIVWLKESVYPKGHSLEGREKIDRFNPDESKRNRPLMGLVVLSGLTYAGNQQWIGGTLYDADSGKTYRCQVTLISKDELDVRGYIGFRLIGRSTTAYRVRSTDDDGKNFSYQENGVLSPQKDFVQNDGLGSQEEKPDIPAKNFKKG